MAQQWQVESPSGRCTATGRAFQEGEEFYTVLFEDGESFRRADYSVQAWQGPPAATFCHFKTRLPVKEKRRRLLVADEVLTGFFRRLAGETEPARVQFRFVLALILMRKRLLRYEGSAVENGVDVWQMALKGEPASQPVVNPRLTAAQIENVSKQLSSILHGDMGEWANAHDELGSVQVNDGSDGEDHNEQTQT